MNRIIKHAEENHIRAAVITSFTVGRINRDADVRSASAILVPVGRLLWYVFPLLSSLSVSVKIKSETPGRSASRLQSDRFSLESLERMSLSLEIIRVCNGINLCIIRR